MVNTCQKSDTCVAFKFYIALAKRVEGFESSVWSKMLKVKVGYSVRSAPLSVCLIAFVPNPMSNLESEWNYYYELNLFTENNCTLLMIWDLSLCIYVNTLQCVSVLLMWRLGFDLDEFAHLEEIPFIVNK